MPEKPLGNTTFVNRFLYAGQGKILCATGFGLFLIRQDRTGLWKAAELKPVGANLPERLTEIVAVGKDRYLISAPPFGIFEADLIGDEILIHRIFLKGIDTRSLLIADGRCRISKTTGLADLDIRTGKFRILDRKNGLLNESIYGMVPDSRGNLWISSNQGLFLFDVSKENFRHFTAVSGLQSNEFNSGAFCKGKSGKIYFGGIHGINWFDPEHFYKKIKAPMVVLSGFFVNGSRKVQMKSITELQYDQNDIRFTFSAIDFSTPQGNKIRYCLRGWDENPILTEGREAIYNNLQPGSYRLEYQSCNARGEWSTLKRVDFYIRPPFWKTIWFYLLSGGSGIAFLIFIIQFNEKRKLAERLREAEQQSVLSEERIRISSEMHDDIGAGLTRISLMTQAARKQSGSSEDLIEGIGETSRQLVESMGEIIWSMSDESRSPAQIMAYIREMVNRQLEYSTMKPEFQFSLESPDIKLSNHLKRSLILMAKELVNNAIKYSGATCIRIGIVLEKSSLSLEVRDNGCGFSGETEGYGNGLKILKTRVEKSQGSFNAGNEQGAFVRIRIALN
jgi:signal transduction histidine kinase